jgi:methylthioribose-1-phosphate isomerase
MTATLTTRAGEITAMAAALYGRGWMPGTAGNISAREGGTQAVITGSGRSKGELTEHDLVTVSIADSAPIAPGGVRPSAETVIHTAVYRATGCGAVVHVHSPYATAVSVRYGRSATTTAVPIEDYELLKGLGLRDPSRCTVPVFPNWTDVPRIAHDVEAYLNGDPAEGAPVLLIAGHGATSWGRDLTQARDRMECLEAICELITLTGRTRPWGTDGQVC